MEHGLSSVLCFWPHVHLVKKQFKYRISSSTHTIFLGRSVTTTDLFRNFLYFFPESSSADGWIQKIFLFCILGQMIRNIFILKKCSFVI